MLVNERLARRDVAVGRGENLPPISILDDLALRLGRRAPEGSAENFHPALSDLSKGSRVAEDLSDSRHPGFLFLAAS